MKSIEVKTTQNVTLEYELADLRDRVLAFIIDLIVILVVTKVMQVVGNAVFTLGETGELVLIILRICVFLFYALAIEVLNNGQSVGKMAMKIQVIKTIGGQATFSDYAARWAFRMIDIWFSFGGVAAILIASSAKAQRIGDVVANTAVIKLVPKMNLRLNDLLAIKSQASYTPSYIQVKQLEETDVLLIKATLERQRQFKNLAHEEAVKQLAEKVRSVLNIVPTAAKGTDRNMRQTDTQFLQTVLNDYVVLTR